MKKWILIVFVAFMLISMICADVRINEIVANPTCTNDDCEYIEIYSDEIANLTLIEKSRMSNKTFDISVNSGYNVFTQDETEFTSFWNITINLTELTIALANSDEVWIYDNNSILIDNFVWESTTENKSWSYNGTGFQECMPTPGELNNCTVESGDSDPEPDPDPPQDPEVEIELEWNEDDIVNGEEFEIEVKAYNLENEDYDVKVWIENSDGDIISERYGDYSDEEDIWRSGQYYAEEFLEGDGDKSKDIDIRIDEEYRDFSGEADIFARIRITGEGTSLDYFEDEIEIDQAIEDDDSDDNDDSDDSGDSTTISTGSSSDEVIRLSSNSDSSDIEAEENKGKTENSIIYKSRNEYIKEYAIYGFCGLCIGVIILLLIDRR